MMADFKKIYESCLSGEDDCLNPEPHLRPTQLTHEDTISTATGYCSYCRRAGIGPRDRGEPSLYTSDVLVAPSEEDVFNDDEYESFDPDAFVESQKIPQPDANEKEDDPDGDPDPGDNPETDLSSDEKTTSLDEGEEFAAGLEEVVETKTVDPSEAQDQNVTRPQPRKGRGRPRKFSKNETDEKSKNKGKRGRPRKVVDLPKDEAQAPSKILLSDSIFEPGDEDFNTQQLLPKEEASSQAVDLTKAVAVVEEKKTKQKETRHSSRLLSRLLTRPSDVAVAQVFGKTPKPREFADGLGVSDVTRLKRIFIGLTESLRAVYDVVTGAGRISLGVIGLPFVIIGTLLQLPLYVIGLKPAKLWRALTRGLLQSIDVLHFMIKPMSDGRAIPSIGFMAAAAGVVLSPFVAPAISVAIMGGGSGATAGWIIWRGIRGVITGNRYEKKKRQWDIDWQNTEGLSTIEIHALNNQFEKTVAEAFSDMGFEVKLNGTQAARENGHKGSGDGGVDVFIKDDSDHLSVVSCKRYSSPVGAKEVRDIFAVAQSSQFHGARPIVVTTVGYTQPAIDFAKKNNVILLKVSDVFLQALRLSS